MERRSAFTKFLLRLFDLWPKISRHHSRFLRCNAPSFIIKDADAKASCTAITTSQQTVKSASASVLVRARDSSNAVIDLLAVVGFPPPPSHPPIRLMISG